MTTAEKSLFSKHQGNYSIAGKKNYQQMLKIVNKCVIENRIFTQSPSVSRKDAYYKKTLIVEEPGKQHLNQMIHVNIMSNGTTNTIHLLV